MLAACSVGERVRDGGGHSLVVLNDAAVMVRCLPVLLFQRIALVSLSCWEGKKGREEGSINRAGRVRKAAWVGGASLGKRPTAISHGGLPAVGASTATSCLL
jgi:hypothetical protein